MKTCPYTAFDTEFEGKNLRTHGAVVPDAHSLEDVMTPEYFGPLCRSVRIGDKIEVRPISMKWAATLYVRDVNESLEIVHTEAAHSIVFASGKKLPWPKGWTAELRGADLWTIVCNGKRIQAGFQTETAAFNRAKVLAKESAGQPVTADEE